MNHLVEFRSYNLKPGTREEFHRLFLEAALPLLQHWNVDVAGYGPSIHDENSYYLIRVFDSLTHREQSEDSFYGSEEWRKGPREAILACIENYTEFVLELDDVTVQGLRRK
ncbi:MAG: NIPSNAP family protein [Anaerolineales bacterium]